MERKDRILLVDDEVNILHALKRLLRREGYVLKTAESGEDGLVLLQEEPVDLIISDQRMPGMSGVEFLEKARLIYPGSVRMILSGYTDLSSITDAINRGHVFKFILKPWDDMEFKGIIREALEMARLQRENHRLTDELKSRNRELQRMNEKLEEMVASRTEELKLRNTALENFQYILYQMPIGVVGIGDDDRIAFVNRWTLENLSQPRIILHGQPVEAALGSSLATALKGVTQEGDKFVLTLESSGLDTPLEVRGTMVRYPGGAHGHVLLFIDRAELKKNTRKGKGS